MDGVGLPPSSLGSRGGTTQFQYLKFGRQKSKDVKNAEDIKGYKEEDDSEEDDSEEDDSEEDDSTFNFY
jgi:hypothetical protein